VRFGIAIGITKPFMTDLVAVVADMMKGYYPYVLEQVPLISKLVKAEEERFHKTLSDGESLLNTELAKCVGGQLDGKTIFKLYDTYGFPVDLTREIAEEHGVSVDLDGFRTEMEIQRNRARAAREDVESMSSQSIDLMNFTAPTTFVGLHNRGNRQCCYRSL
jgi:alanyl-tRNA synthetase